VSADGSSLPDETELDRLLKVILESAVDAVGFDAATITARRNHSLSTIATTDQQLVALDDAQYASGEGPCLSVLDPHEPILLEDVSEADAWEGFRAAAERHGVVTSLSVHIPSDLDGVASSLNFYGRRRIGLGEQNLHAAQGYAAQLAVAMKAAESYRATTALASGLAEAMQSRAVIEQAKGILIADHGYTAEEAFERLRQVSQSSNVKLRDVARRYVEQRASRGGRRDEGGGAAG
jgi:hypothetical protein